MTNYSKLFKLIDSLPDDIIRYLKDEYCIQKWGNIYVNVHRISRFDPRYDMLDITFKLDKNNKRYVRGTEIKTGDEKVKMIQMIKNTVNSGYYKWIYLNNGDIIYECDTWTTINTFDGSDMPRQIYERKVIRPGKPTITKRTYDDILSNPSEHRINELHENNCNIM